MIDLICSRTCTTCRKAVALLDEKGVEYRYRDYVKNPLSEAEIRGVLARLGLRPKDVLRTKDRAFQELGLTGGEPDAELIAAMAGHPTLLQRPIGIVGDQAVVGRPPERLLELAKG
jgi:arsenate reductase